MREQLGQQALGDVLLLERCRSSQSTSRTKAMPCVTPEKPMTVK